MLNGNIHPSTLEGVKRLANQIKKDRGIKHSEALDLASRAANCENFRHARRVLPANARSEANHPVLLTVYWKDNSNFYRGRETLTVNLSKAILEVCGKKEIVQVRGFGWMRMVAADHFVSDHLAASQRDARGDACLAARSLRFMEHTGLRPAPRDSAFPDWWDHDELPNCDHTTAWLSSADGQYILVDEPYRKAIKEDAREKWARAHKWHLRKSAWPGMYFPHSCDLHVATDGNGDFDFEALMKKVDAIPAPVTVDNWTGDSDLSWDIYVSPAAKTPQDRRRAQSKGTVEPMPSAKTIPYSTMLCSRLRRPAGSMPVADHIEVGRLIKEALYSGLLPHGAFQRMNGLRQTLEDWLGREIGRSQLNGPEFFDVYYSSPRDDEDDDTQEVRSSSDLVRILGQIKRKLQAAYPDCAPLRKQLQRIDMSAKLVAKAGKGLR